MKEFHFDEILVNKRHNKGISQGELAEFLGVSKAAVSKWETGQSYPDILLLPAIASYFQMSIDELIGYTPQLTNADITRIYQEFCLAFTKEPFEQVMERCENLIKKYYSCFPFLYRAGLLYINHGRLAGSPEKEKDVYEKAAGILRRVKEESTDLKLKEQALKMEAYAYLAMNRPSDALKLLEVSVGRERIDGESLLAMAYQMSGNTDQAKEVLQIGIFQCMLEQLNMLLPLLNMETDERRFDMTVGIIERFAEAFDITHLHPAVYLSVLLGMAGGCIKFGKEEKALEVLETYTNLACGKIYPLRLHGNEFFDRLSSWFEEIGPYPPREESLVRQDILMALKENPAFETLRENRRFNGMIERLSMLNRE